MENAVKGAGGAPKTNWQGYATENKPAYVHGIQNTIRGKDLMATFTLKYSTECFIIQTALIWRWIKGAIPNIGFCFKLPLWLLNLIWTGTLNQWKTLMKDQDRMGLWNPSKSWKKVKVRWFVAHWKTWWSTDLTGFCNQQAKGKMNTELAEFQSIVRAIFILVWEFKQMNVNLPAKKSLI